MTTFIRSFNKRCKRNWIIKLIKKILSLRYNMMEAEYLLYINDYCS